MVSYVALEDASFLDLNSGNTNGTAPTGDVFGGTVTFNVALVLERANDPTDLLKADWATRQKTLAGLEKDGTLWSTYGADEGAFQSVVTELGNLGITVLNPGGDVNAQYVTSAESRTIWVQLDQSSFTTLFGPDAALRLATDGDDEFLFWEGNLNLPEPIAAAGVKGLWFDTGYLEHTVTADPGAGKGVVLPDGAQSPGNSASSVLYPNEIAALYNFPFADPDLWQSVRTGTVGLVESGIGSALPHHATASFDELLAAYRALAGITAPLPHVATVAGGGQTYSDSGERSLDVGVVTAINPNSKLVLYAGSGSANGAGSDPFTAYQSAIWDTVHDIDVLSSSDKSFPNVAAGSPFLFALEELFVDAALRNITVVNSVGDGGSGNQYANGLTNVSAMHANQYALAIGGTSLSTVGTAEADKTLKSFYDKALKGNRGVISDLVKGGMTTSPTDAAATAKFIETVWNDYGVHSGDIGRGTIGSIKNPDIGGYLVNLTTSGGVDIRQHTPGYQIDFGLDPRTADPRAAGGRGVPDVAALAGGNMAYLVPTPDLGATGGKATHPDGGTSAASPFWAGLMAQVDAIFADQNLPRLGYMNDLLYIAAVVAPAAFNDITVGNNTSSFVYGGDYLIGGSDETVKPTGYGYAAGDGYDYVSGLGTPNGVLLARALSAIAHTQMSHGEDAAMVKETGEGGFRSAVKQGLLIQVTAREAADVTVRTGDGKVKLAAGAADKFAWDSRLAQQVLQPEFDPKLVKMFDGESQSALAGKGGIKAGADLGVKVDKLKADAPQGTLSADYGFIDYTADGAHVRIARPVAVAETVGGADDQVAVVRFRQATKEKVVLKLYKVDDFKGKIDGLKPGEKGYNAAANERAYETLSGKTKLKAGGYGKYHENKLKGIDSGDIVAMKIKSGGHTYFAFAQGNETVGGDHVGHLWNYGLNTWGWEADYKGGDRDYNDLVVQIDFTSAYGEGWLM